MFCFFNFWIGLYLYDNEASGQTYNYHQDYNGLPPGILTTGPWGLKPALRRQLLVDRSELRTNSFFNIFNVFSTRPREKEEEEREEKRSPLFFVFLGAFRPLRAKKRHIRK